MPFIPGGDHLDGDDMLRQVLPKCRVYRAMIRRAVPQRHKVRFAGMDVPDQWRAVCKYRHDIFAVDRQRPRIQLHPDGGMIDTRDDVRRFSARRHEVGSITRRVRLQAKHHSVLMGDGAKLPKEGHAGIQGLPIVESGAIPVFWRAEYHAGRAEAGGVRVAVYCTKPLAM